MSKTRYDWIVTRYTRERFWVPSYSDKPLTKEQAINKASDPYEVVIVRETAQKRKVKP